MSISISGKNSVFDAIENKLPIEKVYVQKGHPFPTNLKISIEYVERRVLDNLSSENHQGYIALIKDYNYFNIDVIWKDKPECVLVLDHIHDPQNFGSIIRICNAAGVSHIIIAKDRQALVTPSVLKVSSGGFVNMKIIQVTNLVRALEELKKHEFWVYGSALTDDAILFKEVKYNLPSAIVIGNESKGVSQSVLKVCDQKVVIPMKGTVQSLNASIATAILLFSR